MEQPSYLCSVLSARALVLGLCFLVAMNEVQMERPRVKDALQLRSKRNK